MTNLSMKPACLFVAIILTVIAYSQTTTINYLNSSLSTSDCNVFDPAVNLNNISHQSRAGGVSFNTTDGLILSTIPSGQSAGGTAFVIQYNFTTGNTYSIGIAAKGNSALSLKATVVPNLNQFNTTGTGSCTPDANVTGYNTVGTGNIATTTSTTSATYNSSQFTVPSNYQYLIVWATGGQTNLNLDALAISQLTITQSAPAASFTLPATTSVTCGSNSPITFTITNVNNTPGVTGYTWNLGSNNGWLYNGSAAPSDIPTTNNTLTLTPVCGTTQNNVFAVVTANGINYSTNTSSISILQPSMSINGNTSFCSGTPSYSINNLPCNASVTWTANPNGIVSLSCTTCTSTNLTKLANGQVTLTATITACGVQTVKNISIEVGLPAAPQFIEIYGNGATDPTTLCPGAYRAEAFTFSSSPQYEWRLPEEWSSSVSSGNNPFTVGSNGFDIPIQVNNIYSYPAFMWVRSVNACGTSDVVFLEVGTDCYGYKMSSPYTISPNPATSFVQIDGSKNKKLIKEIQLIDKMGQVKKAIKYKGNLTSVKFDVSGIKPDTYYIKIYDGKQWVSKALQIQ